MDENFAKEVAQFGRAIKKLREDRGLTQEDVLERTGIARSTLVEIENGRQFPRGLNILRLCVAFEISPSQLSDLAFKKWEHPVTPLTLSLKNVTSEKITNTSSRIGASAKKYGEALVASGAKTPDRIRSTRMRVDRGGTACIIVIQILMRIILKSVRRRRKIIYSFY